MVLIAKPDERRLIRPLIQHFKDQGRLVSNFLDSLLAFLNGDPALKPLIHTIRSRIKDADHLLDKLLRKLRKAEEGGAGFDITKENLLTKITDLAGIRILHLHTRQIEQIDKAIKRIVAEQSLELIEGPSARTWDDESREFYKKIGIETVESKTLYTSVHYVIGSKSQTKVTCEIQVRTLMEEVWGEVDHTINYPHPNRNVACTEQIRALARSTSSATRLVDAIFATVADINGRRKKSRRRRQGATAKKRIRRPQPA